MIDTTIHKLVNLQHTLNSDLCKQIFENDGEHLWNKFVMYDYNLLTWINMLDFQNTAKLLNFLQFN